MTKSEKISIGVSLFAVIASLLTPLLGFLWLNDFELNKKYRPILRVETTEILALTGSGYVHWTTIKNEGEEEAKDVVVWLEPRDEKFSWSEKPIIYLQPPGPFSTTFKGNSLLIKVDRALGHNQSVSINIDNIKLAKEAPITGLIESRVYHSKGEAERYHKITEIKYETSDSF